MPSSTEINLKTVIDMFTPDILGVIWITNEELSGELSGFDQFNYLFDGLLSQYLHNQMENVPEKNPDRSNVFFTKNFNQKLFLAHLKMHGEIAGVLDDQIALIQENKNDERKKILLLNLTEKNWSSELQKRYPQFEFSNLELSKT